MDNEAINIKSTTLTFPIFNYLTDWMTYRLTLELKEEHLDIPQIDIEFSQSSLAEFIKEKVLLYSEVKFLLLAPLALVL